MRRDVIVVIAAIVILAIGVFVWRIFSPGRSRLQAVPRWRLLTIGKLVRPAFRPISPKPTPSGAANTSQLHLQACFPIR